MERWVQTCRNELLDRTLIWHERHLCHALRQFELHHNAHRPHQAMNQAAPLRSPRTDHRSHANLPSGHTPPRPTRRSDPRVPARRLTWSDEIFGSRSLLDAILYANRTGIPWRYLLLDYPQRRPPW
ncbi:hypothetical protein ABZ746_24400 [Streptomyces sp. NPDC020096]